MKDPYDYSPEELHDPEQYSFTVEGIISYYSADQVHDILVEALRGTGLVVELNIHIEKENEK